MREARGVAIVTGASRGVGKGIALGLGEAGWTVYVTSRTSADGESPRPGSGPATAREIEALGGTGIAVRCDHARDDEGVLRHPELFPNAAQAWSPLFNGRVVAALASDPDVMTKSGRAFEIATLAHEFGIDDVDGRRPALRAVERQTGVAPPAEVDAVVPSYRIAHPAAEPSD